MIPVWAIAPVSPAASANGTVSPSAMPITMSRTTSLDVKCRSIWGVWGILVLSVSLELSEQHKHSDNYKRHGRSALYPFERDIITDEAAHDHAQGRHCGERQTRADKHGPRLFRLGRHRHRGKLRFVAHLGEKNYSKRRQQHTKVHTGRSCSLRFSISNQYRVANQIAARTCELFSVARPGEAGDQHLFKIRHLFRWTTIERLTPNIRDIKLVDRVTNRFAVGRPLHNGQHAATRRQIERFQWRAALKRNYRESIRRRGNIG